MDALILRFIDVRQPGAKALAGDVLENPMHRQVHDFAYRVHELTPASFDSPLHVLEIGARNVNGTLRPMFIAQEYVGCDIVEGPGVDLVRNAKDLDYLDGSFDTVFSTETLEHTSDWQAVLKNMWRMTKPGGLMFVTAAGVGRQIHGDQGKWGDSYRNLLREDLDHWREHLMLYEEDHVAHDIRAAWRKPP